MSVLEFIEDYKGNAYVKEMFQSEEGVSNGVYIRFDGENLNGIPVEPKRFAEWVLGNEPYLSWGGPDSDEISRATRHEDHVVLTIAHEPPDDPGAYFGPGLFIKIPLTAAQRVARWIQSEGKVS